jgi:hypothetical protein
MQFSTSTILALVALVPSTLAHMYVSSPEVYLQDTDNKRTPLSPSGSNYPCYETSGHSGTLPTYSAGSSQKFSIAGSAVHGGGSCQISITYDLPVNKDSQFHVLKSFHGDCPTQAAGNLGGEQVFDLGYQIPVDMPKGKAVVAWTWFNRVGIREMYMRCAPVEINSAQASDAALKALPTIWKAHIGAAGAPQSCSMQEPQQYRFPNPGSAVQESGSLIDFPETCRAFAGPTPTRPPTQPILIGKPEEDKPEEEQPAEEQPAEEQPEDDKPEEDKPEPANPPVKPTKTNSPVATATVVPVKPGNGGCSEDGQIICTSDFTWSICDHGNPAPMGRVAPGMVCRQGEMRFAKRSVRGMRFGHEHRRRHHKRSGNL